MNPQDDTKRIQILMVFFLTFYLMIFSYKVNAQPNDCWVSRGQNLCPNINYDYEDALIERYLSQYGKGLDDYELNKKFEIGSFADNISANWESMNNSARKAVRLFNEITLPMIKEYYPKLLKYKVKKVKRHKRFIKKKSYVHISFLKKIRKSIVKNIILTDLLAQLYDLEIDDETNIYFAMAHPFYDAIFDMDFEDVGHSRNEMAKRVRKIIMEDYNLDGVTKIESLIIEITKRLYAKIPARNRDVFFRELKKLDKVQFLSISQQNDPTITDQELKNTTFKKGGLSLELYVLLADKEFTEFELDLFFIFGASLQNADDIEDIEEDLADGSKTLANMELITPYELYLIVGTSFEMLDFMVQKGEYNEVKVNNFKKAIHLFILSSAKKYAEFKSIDKSVLSHFLGLIKLPLKAFKKTTFFVLAQFYPLISEVHGSPRIKFLKDEF